MRLLSPLFPAAALTLTLALLAPAPASAQTKTAASDGDASAATTAAPAFVDYTITRFSGTSYVTGRLENVAPVDSGFIGGSNFYGDTGKGTFLELPSGVTSAQLTSVDIVFAYKSASSTASLELKIYGGTPASGPTGTALTTVSVPLSSINATSTFPPTSFNTTRITLPRAVTVPASFFVAIEFPTGTPGLIGIAKSPTVAGRNAYVWERWDNGSWYNLSDAWYPPTQGAPGDRGWEMPITANVSTGTAAERGLAADGFGLRLRSALPATGRLAVELSLPQSAPAHVALVDALGRTVATLADGLASAGATDLSADVSGMAPGLYVVRLASGARVATLPVVVR